MPEEKNIKNNDRRFDRLFVPITIMIILIVALVGYFIIIEQDSELQAWMDEHPDGIPELGAPPKIENMVVMVSILAIAIWIILKLSNSKGDNMNLKEKLEEKKRKMQEQMQRGRERTQQERAEKLRKKVNKIQNAKPGAVTTMRKGMISKSSPLSIMKEEYSRRKYEREQKYHGKGNDTSK